MRLEYLFLLSFLAALVLVGARLGFSSLDSVSGRFSGFRVLSETGTPFIVIGALVGPQVLNLLSAELLRELSSILILGLGIIGFLYGSHFEWRRMRRFTPRMYGAGITESTFTLCLVTAVCWCAVPLFHPEASQSLRLAVSLSLGVCASGTAPAGVFLLAASRRVRRADIQVLRFFAAIDDLPGLIVLGVLFSFLVPRLGSSLLEGWQRLLMTLAAGVLTGAITHWLFPRSGDERQNTLVLLGMAALGAGSAALLRVSALFVGVIAGLLFANLSPRKESAYGLLASREHSLYAVFLLVAGAMFRFESTRWLWLMVPTYVVVRGVAKVFGAFIGRQVFLPSTNVSKNVGAGLLFQGGMPLVIAVHVDHSFGEPLSNLVMTTFVLAVFLNDLVATAFARAALQPRR